MVLLRRYGHQMRQDRERHILEGNRASVEQLQIICSVCFDKRRNLFRIKLTVVSALDTGFQLFLREISQELLHNCISYFLICFMG